MRLPDLTKIVDRGGEIADNVTESGEERQQALTDRHRIDMVSDSWLSKNIRPIALLFSMFCQLLIILAYYVGVEVDLAIISQVGLMLGSSMGFYFDSRRREKVAAYNAKVNLDIEKTKLKAEIHTQKMKDRHERRLERREMRKLKHQK